MHFWFKRLFNNFESVDWTDFQSKTLVQFFEMNENKFKGKDVFYVCELHYKFQSSQQKRIYLGKYATASEMSGIAINVMNRKQLFPGVDESKETVRSVVNPRFEIY